MNAAYIGVDYATQDSDFTACVVIEVDENRNIHVLECDRIKHNDMYESEKKKVIEEHVTSLTSRYGATEIL